MGFQFLDLTLAIFFKKIIIFSTPSMSLEIIQNTAKGEKN